MKKDVQKAVRYFDENGVFLTEEISTKDLISKLHKQIRQKSVRNKDLKERSARVNRHQTKKMLHDGEFDQIPSV